MKLQGLSQFLATSLGLDTLHGNEYTNERRQGERGSGNYEERGKNLGDSSPKEKPEEGQEKCSAKVRTCCG